MTHTMRAAGVDVVGDNTIERHADGAVLLDGIALNVAVQLRSLGVLAPHFGANGDDADKDALSIADAALRGGAALAAATRGAASALASDGASAWRCEAERVELIDTTGARDGFNAVLCGGAPVPYATATGARRAALTCAHQGGFPQ